MDMKQIFSLLYSHEFDCLSNSMPNIPDQIKCINNDKIVITLFNCRNLILQEAEKRFKQIQSLNAKVTSNTPAQRVGIGEDIRSTKSL